MAAPKGNKFSPGRPSKYDSSMDDKVIELGRQGKTVASAAVACGISLETLHDWSNPNSTRFVPSFSEALRVFRTLSREVWEQRVADGVYDKEINSQVLALLMRNQHGYDSKASVSVDGEGASKLTLNITLNGAGDDAE